LVEIRGIYNVKGKNSLLIEKEKINLDEVMVEVKLLLKGANRKEVVINCLASDAMEFVDCMAGNEVSLTSATQRKRFENKFYFFDDYVKKETVGVNILDVKLFTIPFFMDEDDKTYNFQIATYKT